MLVLKFVISITSLIIFFMNASLIISMSFDEIFFLKVCLFLAKNWLIYKLYIVPKKISEIAVNYQISRKFKGKNAGKCTLVV